MQLAVTGWVTVSAGYCLPSQRIALARSLGYSGISQKSSIDAGGGMAFPGAIASRAGRERSF